MSPEAMASLGSRSAIVRQRRALIKHQVKTGELPIEDVLDRPEAALGSLMLGELLSWAPGFGPGRAEKLLRTTSVLYTARIGRLRVSQRALVLAAYEANLIAAAAVSARRAA